MHRQHRLRQPALFEHAQRRGRTWSNALLLLHVSRNDVSALRCGFAVSRRVGTAVQRNRVRRRLREAMRHRLPHLSPGWDLVLVARPSARGATFAELSAAVEDLLRRARLLSPDDQSGP